MRRACSGRGLFGHAQIYWLHAQAWLAPEVASPFGVRSPFILAAEVRDRGSGDSQIEAAYMWAVSARAGENETSVMLQLN